MMPPDPSLFAVVAGAFGGAAAVLAFVDKRDRGIESRIETRVTERFEKQVGELRSRVDRLEINQGQALHHIINAIRMAATLRETEALIHELELAAEALN
ncbi:MAG: hypothetical protein ACO1SV_12355 [Fimbriimonas sp.]